VKYAHFDALPDLIAQRLITKRAHPRLPLDIYNYSASAQFMPIAEWTQPMMDCRGLILDRAGEIVGRPFAKFWNYEQVLDRIPAAENFSVWEKVDGSLGIICTYAGERVVATRGSFESEQAQWLAHFLGHKHRHFCLDGTTYLVEIVFPANRIVVDYGKTEDAFLLAVLDDAGTHLDTVFDMCDRFRKAKRFDRINAFDNIDSNPAFAGQEGFVVRWAGGMMAKVKLAEYKRLHRLITQCSTRTIWELLRSGSSTAELIERVPLEFAEWVKTTTLGLRLSYAEIEQTVRTDMLYAPPTEPRKDFAMWAKTHPYPGLLFSLLDGKPISDAIWKLIEPKWSTPFRKEVE
jgi:RNA ligase